MGAFRFAAGSPVAIIVTAAVFLLMYGLIKQEFTPSPVSERPELIIGPQITETPPGRPEYVKPTALPERPPEPATQLTTRTGIPNTPIGPVPVPEPEIGSSEGVIVGGLQPLIRVAPQYPASCASRNLSGRATVRYDVTSGGAVTNVQVISISDRCFERAARKTIESWKYRPSTKGGGMQAQGLTQTFVFELDNQ